MSASQAPGPLPHSLRLGGEDPPPPSPPALAFRSALPSPTTGLRAGTGVLAAAKISHQHTARESGESELGMDSAQGCSGSGRDRSRKAAKGSPGRFKGLGRKDLEEVKPGRDPENLQHPREEKKEEKLIEIAKVWRMNRMGKKRA